MSTAYQERLAIIYEAHQHWQSNGLGNLTVREMVEFNRWISRKELEWKIDQEVLHTTLAKIEDVAT